jgi:hypothetical protein
LLRSLSLGGETVGLTSIALLQSPPLPGSHTLNHTESGCEPER